MTWAVRAPPRLSQPLSGVHCITPQLKPALSRWLRGSGKALRVTDHGFPLKDSSILGQFWLPEEQEKAVTGVLEVDGSAIRLQVSPGLTPMHTFDAIGPGNWAIRSTADPEDMAILGSIPERPQRVTLWDAHTIRRRALGMPSPSEHEGPSAHGLEATWLVVGDHIPDHRTKIFGVRPDVTNLAEWAWIPALATSFYPRNRLKLDWHLDIQDKSLDARLAGDAGYITLSPGATHRPPDIRGLTVTTWSQLEIELINGWTLQETVERALQPLADLMTLLSGAPCVVRSLDIWPGQSWCAVYGYRVDPRGPESAGELLFTQPEVGLDFLARWLEIHHRMTPVPQILAAVVRNEFPTIEAEALSLATAVEALHRSLYPAARRFSVDQIDDSLRALTTSGIPPAVAETFGSALRQYWYEHTYPQRVRALAEPVAAAVPTCIGRVGRWKNAVVDQRISLAHGMEQGRLRTDQILRMSALNRSLQWMLTLRLLLLAAVDPTLLANATQRSQRFYNDSALWRRHWPEVYGS